MSNTVALILLAIILGCVALAGAAHTTTSRSRHLFNGWPGVYVYGLAALAAAVCAGVSMQWL